MTDRRREVTEVFSKTRLRRQLATGLVLGVLAAVAPATGLAQNGGGGPVPIGRNR